MSAARPRHLAALALALAACSPVERPPAPLDRFTFPTGMALQDGHLLVVSSNLDLTYEDDKGGSVLSVDPESWLAGDRSFAGGLRIPSFGGELAVADPSVCGLGAPQVLVTNRLSGMLYRMGLGAQGSLSCGAECEVPIAEPGDGFPYAVAVVCRPGRPPLAYVGLLSSRDRSARMSEVRLDTTPPQVATGVVLANGGGVRAIAYDADQERLLFVTTGASVGWIDLSSGCSLEEAGTCAAATFAVSDDLPGAETRALAVASVRPGRPERLYVGVRIIDPDAARVGVRIEVSGMLLVIDLEEGRSGFPVARVVRQVPMARGLSSVVVLPPRAGRGDVVAVSATDDGELWFYDDEIGAVTGVIGRTSSGAAVAGEGAYGLLAEDRGAEVRLYVGAYRGGFVTAMDLDPDDPAAARVIGRIGG
jgi:hypothetical protein